MNQYLHLYISFKFWRCMFFNSFWFIITIFMFLFSSYFNCFSSLEFLVHFFVFISKGFNSLCHKFLSSKSFSYFPGSETLHNQHHCFKVFLLFYFEFLFNLKLSNNTFWFSICVNFIEFIVPTFKLCYYIICAFWKLLRWVLRQNTEISSNVAWLLADKWRHSLYG